MTPVSPSTSSDMHLSVVIPAYNEEQRIPATIREVTRYLHHQGYASELLIVNDGATDGTHHIVQQAIAATPLSTDKGLRRFELIEYPDKRNRGKGYAVRTGMLAATGQYRLFMDADNSTTIDHLEQFFPHMREYDIVIGSRDVDGADIALHQPWYKEVAGNLGNLFIRAVAVPGIHDTQAGFKLFSRACVEDIFPSLAIDRWGFDVEILAVARHRGFRIKEAPITWVNDERSLVRGSAYLQVFGEVINVRWNLLRGVYGARA